MSDTWLVPGGPVVQENEDGATWLIPSGPAIVEASAPPIGAIMNQLQKCNIGADLYNGALIV